MFARVARVGLVAVFLAGPPTALAACLTLAAHPDGVRLSLLALPADDASFALVYTPTEADAGGTFTRADGRFVVTMNRRFPAIVMQVHRDQSPRLSAGTRTLDLAQWGNRALALGVIAGPCAGP